MSPELYADDRHFRSHVIMARHGFGRGEYKYFAYPLPDIVADLRAALYPRLAPIANRWNDSMGIDVRYPDAHAGFPRAVPRGRTVAADAAAAAIRRRRFQLPPSGRLRRARLPAAGRDPALGAGGRTSPAASSCSPSSGRGCSRGPRSCRSAGATA